MAFCYVTVSCLDDLGRINPLRWLRWKPKFIVLNGDLFYSNMGTARYMMGELWLPDVLARGTNVANARTLQRLIDRYERWNGENGCPEYQAFWAAVRSQGIPIKGRGDDHDFLGDNWWHNLTSLSGTFPDSYVGDYNNDMKEPYGQKISLAGGKVPGDDGMKMTDVLDVWRIRQQGWRWWKAKYSANPPSPGYNGDIPSAMVGIANADDYDIDYFYEDYGPNGEPGGRTVRVIYPDCLSYKSPGDAVESPAKTFLGPVQTQWLFDVMLDAKNKGFGTIDIQMTKDVFGADNRDGLGNYITWRTAFLQFIQTNNIAVSVSSGDKHLGHVSISRYDLGGVTDLTVHCASPCGSRHSPLDQHKELVWAANRADRHVYQVTTVDDVSGTITKAILDAYDDSELCVDVIPFGQRLPVASRRQPQEKPLARSGYEAATITVPASGTAWQNTTGRDVNLVISGGTVSAVAISRDGITFDTLPASVGQVYLGNGEFIRITYSVVPTVRMYPRLTAAGI